MRTFILNRINDISGISGTGIIAEGIEFTDKTVAIRWLGKFKSTVLWESIEAVEKINCNGGNTVIVWNT